VINNRESFMSKSMSFRIILLGRSHTVFLACRMLIAGSDRVLTFFDQGILSLPFVGVGR